MSVYVTTTKSKNLIKVFSTKEELHKHCNEVAPAEVLCSMHEDLKKANEFAKKLHKATPSYEIHLAGN